MPALAEIDLAALTPEQAAVGGALHAEIEVLEDRNAAQAERIRRLEHIIGELNRVTYGKRSEKLTPDQRQLAFEDLVAAAAEIEAAIGPAAPAPVLLPKRPAAARNIGHLPEHLPRIERVIEPESRDCPCGDCPCGCGEMVKIGEDRSERLDIVPAQLRVIVTVRPRYACGACERGVVQAPAPARLIEGALPTEGALAHVLVSKYADHSPLYRQAQIYARSGLDLDRSTLTGWVGTAAFHLRPVADRLARHLKQSRKLFMDEIRAPVLDPGRGKTKTGWLCALARDDRGWGGADPPGVVYFYAPGRGGEHAEEFLEGFNGTVWASAASMTARGALVHSAAQSRKLDRKPCGTASMPRSRINLERVMSDSGLPGRVPRNTRPLPSPS